jgi:hypothetical protein
MNPLTINLANLPVTVTTGDLTDPAHSQSPSAFALDPAVFTSAVLSAPISAISTDSLSAALTPSHDFSWKQQTSSTDSVTFKVTPAVGCSLVVRKRGTILEASDINNDPIAGYQLEVPDGKGYVSIILQVRLEVSLGPSASLPGSIGVKASFSPSDTFIVANHFILDQTKLVKDAILESFGRFILPLGPNSASQINRLNPGDMMESEFVAKLAFTAAVNWGLNESLLSALSKADLQIAASSTLGSILASSGPSVKVGPSLTVDYTHTDGFRSVVLVQQDSVNLLLFKCRINDPKVTAEADANVDPGLAAQIAVKLPQVIQNSAKQLAKSAGTEDATALMQAIEKSVAEAGDAFQSATEDMNTSVSNQIKNLSKLGLTASASADQITEHTVLNSLVFSRPLDGPAWAAAMSGDLRKAVMLGGGPKNDVKMGLGSYVEHSLKKTTTLTFTFFSLKAQQMSEYFDDVKLTYSADGMFQFLDKIGSGASSDFFGHEKTADLYFTVAASIAEKLGASNEGVNLNIVLSDQDAHDHSKVIGRTLTALVGSVRSTPYINLLTADLNKNAKLPVSLNAQFASKAFSRLKVSVKPYTDQSADRNNFNAFVSAINNLAINSDERFPAVLSYDTWVQFNKNLTGLNAPDRTETGPFGNYPMAFAGLFDDENRPDDATLSIYAFWLEEARHFMNFCDDLIHLANSVGPTLSGKGTPLGDLLDAVTFSVKNDVTSDPLHCLNAILVALVRQMGDVSIIASAPPASDPLPKKFEVALKIAAESSGSAFQAATAAAASNLR